MNHQPNSYVAQNATIPSENTHKHSDFAKGRIIKLAFQLRNLGYSEAYLKTLIRALNCITLKVDLDNVSAVLECIARGKWQESYKSNLCDFYSHYCKFYNIAFSKPKYHRDHKIPRVPTEEKIDMLIAHGSKKYALIYTIIKECGLRPVEVANLTLNDIDLEKGVLSITTARL